MKFTNTTGIPDEICNAIINNEYDGVPGSLSASQMNNPVRQTVLIKRHVDKIEIDMSEMVFALFGTAMHHILHMGNKDNPYVIAEKRLNHVVDGVTVSGKFDSFNLLKEQLVDYKTTTVFKIQKGFFEDWEMQLNIYAWLLRMNGYTVTSGKVIAIIRDWKKTQSVYSKDYPSSAIYEHQVEIKSVEEMSKIIRRKAEEYRGAQTLPDDALPNCTDEECWAQPTKFAVKKPGSTRALKLFDDPDSANQFAMSSPSLIIEERQGEHLRCEYFCSVKPFCNQYRERKIKMESPEIILAGLFNEQ